MWTDPPSKPEDRTDTRAKLISLVIGAASVALIVLSFLLESTPLTTSGLRAAAAVGLVAMWRWGYLRSRP